MPGGFHILDQTKTTSTRPEKPIHNIIYYATMTSLEMILSNQVDFVCTSGVWPFDCLFPSLLRSIPVIKRR